MRADLGGPGSWQRYRAQRAARVESGSPAPEPIQTIIDIDPKPDPEPIMVLFDLPTATADAADQLGANLGLGDGPTDEAAAAATRKAWTFAAVGFAVGWLLARR